MFKSDYITIAKTYFPVYLSGNIKANIVTSALKQEHIPLPSKHKCGTLSDLLEYMGIELLKRKKVTLSDLSREDITFI